MTNNEVSVEDFLNEAKLLLPKPSFELVSKAYEVSDRCHKNQLRLSGQPYIIHPVNVAHIILKDLNGQDKIIAAALLHDVIEDTKYNDVNTNDAIFNFFIMTKHF